MVCCIVGKLSELTIDYLLKMAKMECRPNADHAAFPLNDGMFDLLNSRRGNTLLCELESSPDFIKMMSGHEIYVKGICEGNDSQAGV